MNVGSMERILSVFPKARFIHLLRDGVDVVYSWSRLEKYAGKVAAPARRWKSAVTSARDFREQYPDCLLEIRYENLCRDAESTLRRVCSFIKLSYKRHMLTRSDHYSEMKTAQSLSHYENVFESITTDSIGKGRKNLNSEQKEPTFNTPARGGTDAVIGIKSMRMRAIWYNYEGNMV